MLISYNFYHKNELIDTITFNTKNKFFTFLFYTCFDIPFDTDDENFNIEELLFSRDTLFYYSGNEDLYEIIELVNQYYTENDIYIDNEDFGHEKSEQLDLFTLALNSGYLLKLIDRLIMCDQIFICKSLQ